jgi:hypothetical protein
MRSFRRARLLLSLALCPSAALAQSYGPPAAPPADASPPKADATNVMPPAPPTPPGATPTPPPEPPPAEKKPDAPLLRIYATLKPTLVVSSDGVESFSQPNASAPTAAANPVLVAVRDEAHYTLQVAQSRFGLWFNEKAPVRGQIEFDFIDFAKASPTVASVPRVRIAKVEWQLADPLLLIAGQDWDLHAPVNPHGSNLVGAAFVSGNTGFMRQQVKLLYHTDALEFGGAVGFPAANNGPKDNVPEYARMPTFAARAAFLLDKQSRVGVSGIANRWRFAPDQPAERHAFAGAAALFGDLTPLKRPAAQGTGDAPVLNLRFEAYLGKNVANLGALGIGQGSAADDVNEAGGFVSAKYSFDETHSLYALGGTARVLNPSKVVPSYAYAAPPADGTAPAASAAALAGTGPGMRWNRTARLGYEYRHSKAVALLAEAFWFRTRHVLNAQFDAQRFDSVSTAAGGEVALLFTM